MHLTGTELLDWIALRRVNEGGVARHDSGYVDWGRKVPCYLPEVFARLADTELTDLLDVDCGGLRRVVFTPRGLDRYQELTAKRARPLCPEQSSGGCSVPPDWPLSSIAASQELRPVADVSGPLARSGDRPVPRHDVTRKGR